jgi:hypothetical protein
MSANKSASVCAATSSGLLIKIDANRTSQNPTELLKNGQRKHHTSATAR